MNFLLGILEGGGSVDEHPLIQQLLDLFWLLMEVLNTHTHSEHTQQHTATAIIMLNVMLVMYVTVVL